MDNINILNKKSCVGCMACKNICPKNCISIYKDELGFEYPRIDESRCIKCGMCSNACPSLNYKKTTVDFEIVYAAINKDYESWMRSSSGGAFSALCQKYCELNPKTTIYGASYNSKKISVEHKGVNFVDISSIQKSKYVQSSMNDIYSEIAIKLKNNENIIFSGTPCQNFALKKFLQIKRIKCDNILFIDFICHGVGSPRTFKESILSIFSSKKIDKEDVINVNHRGKKINIFGVKSYNTEILTKTNKIEISNNDDLHVGLFSQKLNCRESCEECFFANKDRCSDITISDFKNFYYEFPHAKCKENASTIIIHTEKGRDIFNKSKDNFVLYESNIETIKRHNPLYFHSIKCSQPEKRNKFINEFTTNKCNNKLYCMKKYVVKNNTTKKIKLMIPQPFKEKIKYLIKKRGV